MRQSQLKKLIDNSDFSNVSLKINGETIKFNVKDELAINEGIIQRELKDQPSMYAYVGLLHRKVVRYAKDLELEAQRIYAVKFSQYKSKLNPETKRQYNDDLANQKALANEEYNKAMKAFHRAEESAGKLLVVVRAFEQRKDMLQAINTNNRKS